MTSITNKITMLQYFNRVDFTSLVPIEPTVTSQHSSCVYLFIFIFYFTLDSPD